MQQQQKGVEFLDPFAYFLRQEEIKERYTVGGVGGGMKKLPFYNESTVFFVNYFVCHFSIVIEVLERKGKRKKTVN